MIKLPKLQVILGVLLAVAILIIALLSWHSKNVMGERDRYRNNYESVDAGMEQILVADSLQGVKIRELELSRAELKSYYEGELLKTLKNMDIRLRKMESFTNTAIETTNNINTVFKDTLVRDTVRVEKLQYRSRWFDIDVIKEGHSALVKAVSRDSLIQVVYWDRTAFWKRKEYSQNIFSANPNSVITYSRYIVPEKIRKRK